MSAWPAALVLAATPASLAPAPAPAPAAAAEWMPHEFIVNLSDLPRAYTCNDLWYRFHDVLAAIGARELHILTYDCRDSAARAHASPRVELKFELPAPLAGADTRFADVSTRTTTVRFTPGSPHSLTAEDCELMRQMTAGLFSALDLHAEAKFHCAAAPAGRFAVAVRALLPAS
ncbi:MAG: hypothetical protein PVS2B3_07950 [Steroidobacteraceae bacterium]